MADTATVSATAPPAGVMEGKTRKRPASHEDGSSRRKRKKARQDDADLDTEAGLNKAFARMDGQLVADHIAQKTSRFGSDLSSIELSDLYVSANAIKDTTSFEKPRSLDNLPEFLESFSEAPGKLEEASKQQGSPHTIIIAGAGLRATDLVRAVRKFQKKGNPVAKLFAKHFKVEEQVAFLKKNRTGIAVGTPQRLIDLIENEALSLQCLKRVVIDASHIDQKKRGIMDMRETMMPLVRMLSRKELKEKFTDTKKPVELMFY
ncbi:U3-containing 90S pre-ribosomal complex subunit-domain containing protein [Cercophora scortea]|uniref:U3-containing 90S pre-ribosomal complex subunit-domain containing protein n=1 Tax=Cercophora scortea TaxID=314031 RepID=A0AAE0J3G7_9PEZI|nr:U3-containing 90S pre-ribosomal complex subunit-domain containing protein [Cercophora scortea]